MNEGNGEPSIESDLSRLAAYLRAHRNEIMAKWRQAVRADPALTTGASLPRAQLDDHVPSLLRTFERRLDPATHEDASEQKVEAAAHGLHRWQQGYDLREVARELGRLSECMVTTLDADALADLKISNSAMARARRFWAELASVSIGESIAQYYRLQQAEAASHVHDLEEALLTVREVDKQRAELWHQAAHDLRGNLGVVANVAAGLSAPNTDEGNRATFLRMLERNVTSLRLLLDDVTSLARLQAGKEIRASKTFDVAEVLADLCSGLKAAAHERGLELRIQGTAPFVIDGDAVKIRRLAQNLVLNAIKYTQAGSVSVSWGPSASGDSKRWLLSVVDTGPGFDLGPASPIVGALDEATHLTQQSAADAKAGEVTSVEKPVEKGTSVSAHLQPGEGIGLSIVKRLADLLDATIEVETSSSGTTFRVLFPL